MRLQAGNLPSRYGIYASRGQVAFEQETASRKITGRGVLFTLGLVSLLDKCLAESTHMRLSVQIS